MIIEGVRRLTRYQNIRYARRYLDRLAAIQAADGRAQAGGRLLRETARHLAVRMSYEDVIRVAQAKIDPARMERIAAEIGVKPGEPFTVTEFLKPGIEEMCSILPPWLATRILSLAERRGWIDRVHWAMEVNTASVSGFLRFWLLDPTAMGKSNTRSKPGSVSSSKRHDSRSTSRSRSRNARG
jgi:indolepyruvate ferredoxin oxidoreductase beta subunit